MKYFLLFLCCFVHNIQKCGKLKFSDVVRMFTLTLGQTLGFLYIHSHVTNPHSQRE